MCTNWKWGSGPGWDLEANSTENVMAGRIRDDKLIGGFDKHGFDNHVTGRCGLSGFETWVPIGAQVRARTVRAGESANPDQVL
jgi:hypothetical protein